MESLRRWITTLALAVLSVAAAVAVMRAPEASAQEGGLKDHLAQCAGVDQPLTRLDCFDTAAEAVVSSPAQTPLEDWVTSCADRAAPLERLDCYDTVSRGRSAPPAPEVPRAPPSTGQTYSGAASPECYLLQLWSGDGLANEMEQSMADHVRAGRTHGMFVINQAGDARGLPGGAMNPPIVCAW